MTTSAIAQSLPTLFERLLPRSSQPHNPHFHLPPADLALELERLRSTPALPKRPVLVLAGYHAWSLSVAATARTLHSLIGGPPELFHAMAYPLGTDLPTIARKVVREVSRRWPNRGGEPHRTTEVDVVAISMGGIIARVAASPSLRDTPVAPTALARLFTPRLHASTPLPVLRIHRLFTLATPHRGAALAARLPRPLRPDRAARDLHPDSPFLARLNASLPSARYELVCYTRLRDSWVGASRTAPPGRDPIWTPPPAAPASSATSPLAPTSSSSPTSPADSAARLPWRAAARAPRRRVIERRRVASKEPLA